MPGILQSSARNTAVEHDVEGVRLALLELLEEGYQRGRLQRTAAAERDMTPQRLRDLVDAVSTKRTLSPGFYIWSHHLLRLDAERTIGIELDPRILATFEAAGLRTLASARAEYRGNHPPCGRCGLEQETRFMSECGGCGAKFASKGGR